MPPPAPAQLGSGGDDRPGFDDHLSLAQRDDEDFIVILALLAGSGRLQ